MELKLLSLNKMCIPSMLLIVPYGIETYEINLFLDPLVLLIVPYGIETNLIG